MTILQQLLLEETLGAHIDPKAIAHVCEFDLGWLEGEEFTIDESSTVQPGPEVSDRLDIKIPSAWPRVKVKFGEFPQGHVKAYRSGLGTLENLPPVVGSIVVAQATRLASLAHGPHTVNGDMTIVDCGLTSLNGAPKKVGGVLRLNQLSKLMSLKGLEECELGNDLDLDACGLKTLEGMPKKIGRHLIINCCDELEAIRLPRDLEISSGVMLISAGMASKLSPQLVVTKGLHEIDWLSDSIGWRDDILKVFNEYLMKPKTNRTYLDLQAELIDRDWDWLAEL